MSAILGSLVEVDILVCVVLSEAARDGTLNVEKRFDVRFEVTYVSEFSEVSTPRLCHNRF